MAKEFLRFVNENGRVSLGNPGEDVGMRTLLSFQLFHFHTDFRKNLAKYNRLAAPILQNSGSATGYKAPDQLLREYW